MSETQKYNSTQDRYAELKRKAKRQQRTAKDGYPDNWTPEEAGDTVMGEIYNIGERLPVGQGEPVRPVVVDHIAGDGDERIPVTVWLSSFILRDHYRENRWMEGDLIVITYGGKRESKTSGNEYNVFEIDIVPGPRNPSLEKRKDNEAKRLTDGSEGDNFAGEDDGDELPF